VFGAQLQTIAFLAYLKFTAKLPGPSLVVCPLSVLASWMVECKRFCPALRVVKLHSADVDERERLKRSLRDPSGYDLVVTT
jgi:SWI/SNF-related matrix-associated actin-dependent regulator of chromatin subfamily A member 5